MPGFDRTGPRGLGSRTGGGFGLCGPGAGRSQGGYVPGVVYGVGRGGIPWGCGRGRAFGGGRGRWRRVGVAYAVAPYGGGVPYSAAAPVGEKAFLESEITNLEQQLAAVKSRLAEMGAESAEE
ncbi:MAG: DUF5320 domain-containing protein [Candidatus Eisenbacteria bacterium]